MDGKKAAENLKGLNTVKDPSTRRKRQGSKQQDAKGNGPSDMAGREASDGSKLSDMQKKLDVKKNLTVSSPRRADDAEKIVEIFT